ncbi:F-box/WD40 repeat domain-containing protein [Vairimorpha necatrix]|uniref:F-box/WD40 repeat domain-containing protein n=1 Tax=Vairimorpha necatrix TaxID=6039 RepID=A0AAX4J9J2_9MICR
MKINLHKRIPLTFILNVKQKNPALHYLYHNKRKYKYPENIDQKFIENPNDPFWISLSNKINIDKHTCYNEIITKYFRKQGSSWTKQKDTLLLDLVEQNTSWLSIGFTLNIHPIQCIKRYWKLENKREPASWTKEEDKQLVDLVAKYNKNWSLISTFIPSRSRSQCLQRYKRLDGNKGKWTKEEDACLIEAVNKYYYKGWKYISEFVPHRTDSQCRERWVDSLDPKIKKGKWSKEDDEILMKFYGNNWEEISEMTKRINGIFKDKNLTAYFCNKCCVIKEPFYKEIKLEHNPLGGYIKDDKFLYYTKDKIYSLDISKEDLSKEVCKKESLDFVLFLNDKFIVISDKEIQIYRNLVLSQVYPVKRGVCVGAIQDDKLYLAYEDGSVCCLEDNKLVEILKMDENILSFDVSGNKICISFFNNKLAACDKSGINFLYTEVSFIIKTARFWKDHIVTLDEENNFSLFDLNLKIIYNENYEGRLSNFEIKEDVLYLIMKNNTIIITEEIKEYI